MRRDLLLSCCLTAGLAACAGEPKPGAEAPGTPAAPPAGELAYVTNEDSNELTVITVASDSVVGTIPVGKRPRGVRVAADGRTVFVALSGSPKCPPTMPDEECEKLVADKTADGIAVVDVATRTVTRVLPGGSDPETFDLSADGTRLFVSNEDAGTASVVDVARGTILSTVPVGREPEGVRLHPSGETVWVTGETDHDVTVLSTATGQKTGRVVVGRRPRDLAFSPDGSRAYVTSEVDGKIFVVDAKALTVLSTIALPEGSRPMGIVLTKDGTRGFVANGRGATVSEFDPASGAVRATVPAGTRPWGLALSGDGTRLYAANGPSNDVSVFATDSLRELRRIPVGKVPWGVAIGPAPASP